MPEQVQIKDRGWLKLQAFFKQAAKGKSVSVGVQGDEAQAQDHEGGMTNVGLAVIHEYGSDAANIPERSHWRSTFDEKQRELQKELDRIAGMIFDKPEMGTVEGELMLLGEGFKTAVIDKIRNAELPALDENYEDTKSPPGPALWRTGQYVNSFRAVVVDAEKKRAIK